MARLDEAARAQILAALGGGATHDAAARLAGISGAELEDLLTVDEVLAEAVAGAEARAEVANVTAIAKAARGGDWRAGAFLLERSRRQATAGRLPRCGAHTRRCPACVMAWAKCAHAHDSKACLEHPCHQARGFRTKHPGAGHCYLHGGNTPNGERFAATEAAERAVARLGLPTGSGDPMVLLTKAVQHSEGYLEATGQVLAEVAATETDERGFGVAAAAELYAGAIRVAARTGKAAVDADVADRMAALDERAADLLMRFVGELLERFVPAKERPGALVWTRGRLTELAAQYDRQQAIH